MQGSAVRLVVVALCGLIIAGCGGKKKNADGMSADYGAGDELYQPYQSRVADDGAGRGSDPYASSTGSELGTMGSSVDASGQRMHVVAKGDTLFGLARQYYGDQRRWRDIYEANRSTLADPNQIRVGQRLVIP